MSMTKEQIEKFAKTTLAMTDGVTTIADTKGISYKELEAAYRVGYNFYTSGRYDDAEKVFKFLCVFEHTNHKYWTALGAVRQAKKNYEEAIEAYATAALFDMNDPKPHYYSAECALFLGKLDMAENGLKSLLALCAPGSERNNRFRDKAEKLQNVIKGVRETAKAKANGGV